MRYRDFKSYHPAVDLNSQFLVSLTITHDRAEQKTYLTTCFNLIPEKKEDVSKLIMSYKSTA